MYAKVFSQILDSSIANDYQTRFVFEDLLKLCDINGNVDITPEAISRRTNVPPEIVTRGIAELEKPDPRSRNPNHEGRRIIRLDEHRDWGWHIVNYETYRKIQTEEQRREGGAKRSREWRERKRQPDLPTVATSDGPVTPRDAGDGPVTLRDAGDGMERDRKMDYDKASGVKSKPVSGTPTHNPTKAKKLSESERGIADRFESALAGQWVNDAGKWITRIKSKRGRCSRVIAEVESAIKEHRIIKTPAHYAEHIWEEFA